MALVDLVPFLFLILLVAVCWAMLQGYKFTLGPVLHLVADVLNTKIPFVNARPFGFLAAKIVAFDSVIKNWLAQGIVAGEKAWAVVLHAHAVLWHDLTGAVADLAEAAERQFKHLPQSITQTIVPTWVYPLRTTVHYLQRLLARVETKVASLPRTVTNTVTHETTKVITKVEKITFVKVKAAGATITRTVIATVPGLATLDRDIASIKKWIRTHTKILTEIGSVGLVAAALAKLGLTWARCSNVNKWGKSVCGMDQSLLDALLADTLLVLGTVDLIEFAEGMQDLTSEAASTIGSFWRA